MSQSPTSTATSTGPMQGLRVIEFVGIGPGPHCAMMLADLGAEVVRIQREGGNGWPNPIADRGRPIKEVDIRSEAGRDYCRELATRADVVIEGFRPGVMERLGLGPDDLCGANPRLVYARMTGWGQDGPMAKTAGHDINYIAITGALAAMGQPGEPAAVPLNLVGDFGGGGMYLAFGIAAALYEREKSGKGQVIDAAVLDGTASLMAMFNGAVVAGRLTVDREHSLLGGAAPYYRTYFCSDGKEIAVGPLEPQFYAEMVERIGGVAPQGRDHPATWPQSAHEFAAIFRTRTRDEWCAVLEGTDACFAPVLTLDEAPGHHHNKARGLYVEHEGVVQPVPAPRLSRTPGEIQPTEPDGAAVLAAWGVKTH